MIKRKSLSICDAPLPQKKKKKRKEKKKSKEKKKKKKKNVVRAPTIPPIPIPCEPTLLWV